MWQASMTEARQEARLQVRACFVSGSKAQRPRLPPPPPPSPHPAESLRSVRARLLLVLVLLLLLAVAAVVVVVEASINLSLMCKVRLWRLLLTSGLAFFHVILRDFVS